MNNNEDELTLIKNTSQLPDWFELKNYKKTKTLSAAEWYEQLFVRYYLYAAFAKLQNCGDDEDFDEEKLIDAVDHTFAKIQNDPIIDITSDQQLTEDYLTHEMLELKKRMPHTTMGIHSLTVLDLISLKVYNGKLFNKIKKRWVKSFLTNNHTLIGNSLDIPIKLLNESDSSTLNEYLYINWELPDAVLMEHFAQFIKNNRPKINTVNDDDTSENEFNLLNKIYRKPNFNEWHRLAILPYLDLQFWSFEVGAKIPNRVMADAIFPAGEGGEETIRKTTASLAKRLLTEPALTALMYHASLEISEKTT